MQFTVSVNFSLYLLPTAETVEAQLVRYWVDGTSVYIANVLKFCIGPNVKKDAVRY